MHLQALLEQPFLHSLLVSMAINGWMLEGLWWRRESCPGATTSCSTQCWSRVGLSLAGMLQGVWLFPLAYIKTLPIARCPPIIGAAEPNWVLNIHIGSPITCNETAWLLIVLVEGESVGSMYYQVSELCRPPDYEVDYPQHTCLVANCTLRGWKYWQYPQTLWPTTPWSRRISPSNIRRTCSSIPEL